MPEYLAPGVYVEEIDTGAKPIEGVSTSTCGMVGVAERGPVDVPVLVTSVGEYARWFGGLLRANDYVEHRFLPHAVEGFFTNGGKRSYVVRTIDSSATRASSALFDRGGTTSISTRLLRAAGEGTGTTAAPPPLIALDSVGLGADDWVRIGVGSDAEYRQLLAAPAAETVVVPIDLPLLRTHATTEQVHDRTRTVAAAFTLETAAAREAEGIVVRGANADVDALVNEAAWLAGDIVLEVGIVGGADFRLAREVSEVTPVSATQKTAAVGLDAALAAGYAAGAAVSRITLGGTGDAQVTSAVAGSNLVFVDAKGSKFATAARLVVVGDGPTREVRGLGSLSALTVTPGMPDDLDAGTLAEVVAHRAERKIAAVTLATGSLTLNPGEGAGLVSGQQLVVRAPTPQQVIVTSVTGDVVVVSGLGAGAATGQEVVPVAKKATATSPAGGKTLALDDRMGVTVGTILRLGTSSTSQEVTVTALPAQTLLAPDSGVVVVSPPLNAEVASGSVVPIQRTVARGAKPITALVLPAASGATEVHLSESGSFVATDLLRLTTAGGDVSFHWVTSVAAVVGEVLTLKSPLARSHPAGSSVLTRDPLVNVEALDAGAWGNRLRISVIDDEPGLVSRTTLATVVTPTTIRLGSRSGVQPGTVLELSHPLTGAVLDGPVKVRSVDRATGNIVLAAALTALQQMPGALVRSREFTLDVVLLRQPDPATPSRDGQVIDRETFRNLSLDPRHSNYIEKVIGPISGPLRKWDHRTEGASLYIRVQDTATSQATKESVRVGPEALQDRLPDGRMVPARTRLENVVGDDSIGTFTDDHLLGADNVDPEQRTGLQSLRNIEQVSLVAIPGEVSAKLQQGLIDHCELMRYRFAVMDTLPEPRDTISDAQDQRQQFDTKYAALYYPWLAIRDPFPANLADVHDYAIPPAGHMLGVYARTDIERGVHKAPANEVVRGITGLRRKVNKEQQDILNPYPVNINVIRDFRDNNRGIRVYGARVITSDPDWKYVNVRRLLIFIEASIERGLQWVVFEPNSEPLWARVSRVITNFLTVVWRNGALEGTSPEEAFFVRCDRTTMTQTDIDSGRLIVQVGVAPVKPAEFVIVRIGLWTARSDS